MPEHTPGGPFRSITGIPGLLSFLAAPVIGLVPGNAPGTGC